MDEVLEKFLEDQKTKIAEEKACLEQEPPYMEMRRRTGRVLQKENIPPCTCQQGTDGLSLPLGEEYERKKHKLQEELRKDYRKYMEEKAHWDAGDIHTVPERRGIPKTVRVRNVATLTEVCGLGWGVCSSEEDCSDEELILLQGRRHQKARDTRTANRSEELYAETGHHMSKLQHRNRMSLSVATQANERSVSGASQDTVYTTGILIGATDLEAILKRKKEHYRRELQEQIAEKQSHRREKELDLRVARVTDAEKKLFVSEASTYRKQPRDDIFRLDTAEPPEGLLQYRTDPLSPSRMPFIPTHSSYNSKTPNNDSESLLSPSRAYGPLTGVFFPTSSGEPHPLSPHNEHSRSTHRQMFLGENEGVGSGLSVFPAHQAQKNRLSYKEELRQQIEERAAQRRVDREEKRRLDAELDADMRAYEPWGRGGAGAPLKDSTGNLITDLKQMHLLNAAAAQIPERPGFVETHTPQFARGNVFNQMLSPQQLQEQDQYKAYLKLQMEEKQRKQAEERERMRAEEEREDRRLAEQREKIRREYEEEQESRKCREMEQKLKNEELARLAEERRRDAEKKKKEEEKERAAFRKQEQQKRQIRLQQQVQRAPSPPIPTLQNKHRNPSNATDFSPFRAPTSPEHRNHQRTEKDRSEVVNELSVLRRRLRSEQQRLEEQLLRTEWDPLPSPFTDRPRVDVFDMARMRMPVRGPSSRGTEPISSKKSYDIMYRETNTFFSYFSDDFMPLPRTQQSRNRAVEGGRGSVLLSESEFIDQNGVAFPLPPDVERKSPKPSARERRRLANLQAAGKQPVQQQSLSMRKLRDTNTLRMKRLQAFGHHNTTPGGCSDDEDDEDEAGRRDERFTLTSPGWPSYIDPATTEPWIRAESSDTLRRLMSGSEL
ncbi:centrosome and spindle pole-associated protein 1 isoform X2 [Pimephales promelas]|uniref:centrosome and spindle pole-associated protein 1 isoform X2 n=1 Tax=Pimephales promelas TaxID=90988 RepID=UPI00195596C2|nr:centrosome and spindle pole-associated protein 1 isoform X2 [Pimephales promelas]